MCTTKQKRDLTLPFSSKTMNPVRLQVFQHNRNLVGNYCILSQSGLKTDFSKISCPWWGCMWSSPNFLGAWQLEKIFTQQPSFQKVQILGYWSLFDPSPTHIHTHPSLYLKSFKQFPQHQCGQSKLRSCLKSAGFSLFSELYIWVYLMKDLGSWRVSLSEVLRLALQKKSLWAFEGPTSL